MPLLKRNVPVQVFSFSCQSAALALIYIGMETFTEVGERAMRALVEAIRNELIGQKQAHVESLGTFRVEENPPGCSQDSEQTTLTPPARQIVFEADSATVKVDG